MVSRAQAAGTVLYITYDGLTDPLGRTQILPYVLGLAERGWKMAVLSFEKAAASPAERDHVRAMLDRARMTWIPLTYHKTPTVPATLFDIGAGIAAGIAARVGDRITLLHARSYIAGTMALALKRAFGARLLFDMRGFWGDERIEGGVWSKDGPVYRVIKGLEHRLFSAADAVVSLTHAGADVLRSWPSVGGRAIDLEVIPTCADVEGFARAGSTARSGPVTLGYVGSFGGRYLIDETVQIFRALRALRADARMLVLTPRDQTPLWDACARHGIARELVTAYGVKPDEVRDHVARMHATVSLIKPGFSSLASCPTKFGESIAAGAPVVVNEGIGDCAEIVRSYGVGVVTALDPPSLERAAAELSALLDRSEEIRARCVRAAREIFALDAGVARYHALYSRMLSGLEAGRRVDAAAPP
jgi:glycosyltransferase involved in cell wall biosynthesis